MAQANSGTTKKLVKLGADFASIESTTAMLWVVS